MSQNKGEMIMKTVFLMLVLIFILAITTIVSAQTSESNQLRELLTDSACPRACFFDIQTGVTTQQQVQNILAGLNITYEVYAGQSNNDEPNGTYNWIPPTSTPFTTGGQVILHFSNGIARQMLISMNVSVTTVLETFGNPVTMAETDDTYFLEYADLGLVFTVSSRTDPTKVNQAILTADPAINNRFRDGTYGTSPVNQPCSTYGTPPCIAPTAVPATATRTPTPTVSANSQLGLSGNSGLQFAAPIPTGTPHLDISTYYISGEIVEPLRGALPNAIDASVAVNDPTTREYGLTIPEPYNVYSGFFVWRAYGLVALIDPLWVWPLLQDGITGIETQCP